MLSLSANIFSFETIYYDVQAFLSDLINLEKESYFFRGVEIRQFGAQPSAFRPIKMEENRKKFPICYEQILTEWFYHADIIKMIQSWYNISEQDIKRHPIILRLFNLISYLQVCNYLFTKYKEDNPHHIFAKDRQKMEDRDSSFWREQKTFKDMVEYYLPKILTREALDKSWRQDGYIDDIVTGIDMSFPQHYGTSTAALDFTKKYLVAIYFAIECHLNIDLDDKSGLYIAEKANYDDFLSVYAINITSDFNDSQIKIEEIDHSILNLRAKNQQGVLCYLSNPCSYYMKYGQFPKIEDYLIDGKNNHFKFKKLSLKRSIKNLDVLAETLLKENINKNFIYPDL